MQRKAAIKLCQKLYENLPSMDDNIWLYAICRDHLEELSFNCLGINWHEEEDFELEYFFEILTDLKKDLTERYNTIKLCLDLIKKAEKSGGYQNE